MDYTDKLRSEAPSHKYDSVYVAGGAYDRPYRKSSYYPLYRATLAEVQRLGGSRILEVGCGNGSFAQMLFEHTSFNYIGFDFNEQATQMARLRTSHPDDFFVGDALQEDSYHHDYDTIVCSEVLEHVEDDRLVISRWRTGTRCVCSVPNFDYDTHVRYFLSEEEIRSRYDGLIDIDRVIRVKKPLIRGRGIREYFKQLRWSRNNPTRLFAHLGYRTFENLAGWFVFSGNRL